jgi:hypothetical protein
MLQIIAGSLDLSVPQHRVICGAAVLGFFFCLRGSEFLSSNGRRHAYCITTSDVKVVDTLGMDTLCYRRAVAVRLTIKASKTDQRGQSASRELLKGSRPPICPVFAALLLLKTTQVLGKDREIPLCSIAQHQVLSTRTMSRVLRWAAVRDNLDPQVFSTHSLRAGGASALHAAGASIDTIKMHGRWSSDAYQRYIAQPSTHSLDLTRRIDKHHLRALATTTTPNQQRGRTVVPTVRAVRR